MSAATIRELLLGIDARQLELDALLIKDEDSYRKLTYGELSESVRALANGLLDMGICKGDKIGLMAENRAEWPVVYLAVTAIGAVVVPVSILWEPPELRAISRTGDIKLFFTSHHYLDKIAAASPGDSTVNRTVCFDPHPLLEENENAGDRGGEDRFSLESSGYFHFSGILDMGRDMLRRGHDPFASVTVSPEDTAEILFVSSTMGVMLSHRAIMANVQGILKTLGAGGEPGKKLMMIIPFSHLYPTVFGILLPMMAQWTLVTAATGRMDRILRMVKETEPHYLVLVPLLLDRMFIRLQGRMRKKNQTLEMLGFGNLEFLFTAGVKCPEDLIARVQGVGLKVLEGYGVSEMAPFITIGTPEFHRPGSVGVPLCNVELKILNPGPGGHGEILARGPNMMCGYYKPERHNGRPVQEGRTHVDDQGWLHTGDIGRVDGDGFLYITGRRRNIIVSKGGTNIYPREIEKRLKASPLIEDARAVLRWDEVMGEFPYVFIRPHEENLRKAAEAAGGDDKDHEQLIREVLEGLSGQMAAYKIPRGFEIIDHMELSRIKEEQPYMFEELYLI